MNQLSKQNLKAKFLYLIFIYQWILNLKNLEIHLFKVKEIFRIKREKKEKDYKVEKLLDN